MLQSYVFLANYVPKCQMSSCPHGPIFFKNKRKRKAFVLFFSCYITVVWMDVLGLMRVRLKRKTVVTFWLCRETLKLLELLI